MSRIIGWTYEADYHCNDCALKRFGEIGLRNPETKDREGNPLHPVFSTDEVLEDIHCGDCGALIAEAFKESDRQKIDKLLRRRCPLTDEAKPDPQCSRCPLCPWARGNEKETACSIAFRQGEGTCAHRLSAAPHQLGAAVVHVFPGHGRSTLSKDELASLNAYSDTTPANLVIQELLVDQLSEVAGACSCRDLLTAAARKLVKDGDWLLAAEAAKQCAPWMSKVDFSSGEEEPIAIQLLLEAIEASKSCDSQLVASRSVTKRMGQRQEQAGGAGQK